MRDGQREQYSQSDYEAFLKREKNGEVPRQGGPVRSNPNLVDALVNNNTGATGTSNFTQSETAIIAFGNTVVVSFNDAGSNAGGSNIFTGFSRSTDGGVTFTDGGTLPTSTAGDAGDPVLARDETTGRIYLSTLAFSAPGNIQMWRSDDNGLTWLAPVNATPGGGTSQDKQWHAVDNFAGPGNGNVYLLTRDFGTPNGIYMYRSTDNGATFGPSGGTQIVSGNQGAFVAVGPDHSVYAFWYNGATLRMRKSTDFGVTFAAAVVVASGLVGGTNGNLALTGIRQGLTTASAFRSNEFPHVAINPVSGNLYVTYDNDGPGADKADVFIVQSTDGGTTWSAPIKVNDDVTTTDQWQPTIAVSPNGAQIGIFYYSRQEDPTANNLFKYYGRLANISGVTVNFTPSFALSEVASLPEFGRDAVVNTVYMGDYNQASATTTAFHVVWSDNRDDLAGGAPRKDPNVYYKSIPTTDGYGWAKGITVSTAAGNPIISGVDLDITNATPFAGAISDAAGRFKVGARVDTPATTRSVTIRGRKFGYIDTTRTVTITRGDTLDLLNFPMRPAPGGTLSVFSHTATTNLRSYVEVKFGGTTVISDSTNGTTGILTAPLPTGTYSVRVDAPAPNLTRNFPSVVISAGTTTNVDALTQAVLTFNPAAVRDTVAVGGSRTKTLVMTNTTPDTVQFRITDDNALARVRRIPDPSLPSVKRSMEQQVHAKVGKGQLDPTPGQPASPNGRGGPDAFGYSWIDSDEPGGPVFNWTDIRSVGTAITGLGDDTNVGPFPIGFSFPFYGNSYNQVRFCTNGWVSFTTTSTEFTNGAIPSAGPPNNAIYPFWDDQIFSATNGAGAYYHFDAANARFIVQYDSVPHFGTTEPGRYTYQVIFKPNGEMLFQYRRMVGTLNSATIGIENAGGTVALQVVSSAAYMHDSLAVKFFLPDAPWLSESPGVGAIPPNGLQNVQVSFDATGLTPGTNYNANISVDAAHPDVSRPFTVPASLRVIAADSALLVVNKTSITFPPTVIGNVRRDTINARNAGATTLNVASITASNARYTLNQSSATLAPGANVNIIVTYTPVVPAGTDTGRVIFLSNSQGTPRRDVTLTGTAVGAPILLARVDSLVRPAMTANTRDSIRFFVRNTGTLSANYQARAILFPRTAPGDKPGEPIIVPMNVSQVVPINYPNDPIPPSVGFAPSGSSKAKLIGDQAGHPAKLPDELSRPLVQNAYGNDYRSLNWTSFDLATPGTLTPLGPVVSADAIFAGDFTLDGLRFLAIKGATQQLIEVNITNGSYTVVGAVTIDAGHTWTSMKFDPESGTLYAVSTNITVSSLYTINPSSGTTTRVATITNMPAIIGMAIQGGTGQMYGYDIVNDNFFSINKATGVGTLIGPIGFNANLAQDMAFERQTGTLYMAAYNATLVPAGGQLRTVNLATGATTLIGALGVGDHLIDPFSIKGSSGPQVAPWLTIVPPAGTIAIGDSVQMTARFDATDPSIYNNPGNYRGVVEINAPVGDTLKIPARMFVVPGVTPDLVVVPDSVDFGVVALGVTDSSKTVLLRNIGGTSLTITNITSSNPAFSPSTTSRTIASLDTFRLRLRFASAAPAGVKLGTLSFVSNDPIPPTVRMRGVAQGQANIVVAPDTFFFARSTPDTLRTTFRVRNTGTDTLRYVIDEALASPTSTESIIRSTTQQQNANVGKGELDPTPGQPASPDGRGGPDAFGYSWIDSDEPGGPAFNWVDISTTGTAVTTWTGSADDGYFTTTLPWAFPLYGTNYTSINLVTNGFANFGTTSSAFTNGAIPSTLAPNNALYPYWDDFDLRTSGTVYYRDDAANGRYIIQWNNVPHYTLGVPAEFDTLTFQMILRPSGDILYQYLRKATAESTATVGIENSTGTIALQTSFNRRYVKPNLAVYITKDLLPWASTDRTSGIIAPADSQNVQLRIHPSAGLPNGTHRGRLIIAGNSPDIGRVGLQLSWTGGVNSIAVTSPNGGETWRQGNAYQIAWTHQGVDTVKIEYTTNRGSSWNLITPGVPARPLPFIHPKAAVRPIEGVDSPFGTFNWTIPAAVPNSTQCLVRISQKSNLAIFDTSNAPFTITSAAPSDTGWVAQTSGTTAPLYSVKTVDANVGWAAGANGVVLRTTNGGTNWISVGGGALGTAPIYAIEARDANNAWVMTFPGPSTSIYRTINGGTTWTQAYTQAGGFIDGIQMTSATVGYALGDPVPNPGGTWTILRTADGGATWTPIPPALPQVGSEAGWNNSFQVQGSNMWFGTSSTKVYYSTDLGATWSSGATTGLVNSSGLWFNSATLGMTGDFTNGATRRSTNGGAAWAATAAAGTAVTGLAGVNNLAGLEFFATSLNNVLYSTNQGTTWSSTGRNAYTGTRVLQHLHMVRAASVDRGWAVGDTGTIVRYNRTLTDVADNTGGVPVVYALDQNFPNPFNPTTTIKFSLPEQAMVRLKVFNVLGQEIVTLAQGDMPAAFHSVVWNGRNGAGAQVASGMYFYRFEATGVSGETFNSLKKLILLK